MENVKIESQGSVTTSGDTTSLLYLAAVGSAIGPFDFNSGVNEYKNNASGSGVNALLSRYSLRFQDKELVKQSGTLEVQGAMDIIAA